MKQVVIESAFHPLIGPVDLCSLSIRAQAFSAPPYVASFVVAMAATYTADKTQTRGLLLALMVRSS